MKIFFVMVLLSIANQHSGVVKARTLKVLVEPDSPTRLRHPIEGRLKHSSQAPSRGTANALDQLDCHSDPMCFIRTAQSLAEKGEQLDLALACVERAMAIPPRPNDAVPRESFFLTLAYVQIRRREFDQAIATLTRGAQRSPGYASLDQYLMYLGLAYENSSRLDEAIETYMTLAGGLKEISQEPNERLVTLYLKRFGSLGGLKQKIEANRLKARKKFFVDNHLLNIPAPAWGLQNLDGRQVNLSDFSNKILVLSFVSAGGNVQESLLKFLQAQYEKYKEKGIAFVCIDYTEKPDTKAIKTNLAQMGVTIPTLSDSDVARRYKTLEPLIVLIDEKGMIRFKNTIWHNYSPFVIEQIEFLLKGKEK
jgi:tetratricopeptide (TPR) repeat protein